MIPTLPSAFAFVIILCALLLSGCGTATETQDTPPSPQSMPTPARLEFETKTDTVAMEHALLDSVAGYGKRDFQIKYMVQIGAFKDPQYAAAVQTAARNRYHLPVLNDFNTSHALYQIRIGFFETREDAYNFRQKMRKEFPGDYKDAWVVQLKR